MQVIVIVAIMGKQLRLHLIFHWGLHWIHQVSFIYLYIFEFQSLLFFLGNVYIADENNHRIRKITVSTGIISTIAGTGSASYSGDNGQPRILFTHSLAYSTQSAFAQRVLVLKNQCDSIHLLQEVMLTRLVMQL